MLENYHPKKISSDIKNILIAPSWQKDNIVDLCLDDILNNLKDTNYKITVRPHPQQVKHMKEKFEQMKADFKDNKNITIETDFSSSDSIFFASLSFQCSNSPVLTRSSEKSKTLSLKSGSSLYLLKISSISSAVS